MRLWGSKQRRIAVEIEIQKAMRKARTEQHITQRQLAAKTGLTQADISRIENGEANPTLQTLKKIADGLGKKLEIRFISDEISHS